MVRRHVSTIDSSQRLLGAVMRHDWIRDWQLDKTLKTELRSEGLAGAAQLTGKKRRQTGPHKIFQPNKKFANNPVIKMLNFAVLHPPIQLHSNGQTSDIYRNSEPITSLAYNIIVRCGRTVAVVDLAGVCCEVGWDWTQTELSIGYR